MSRLVVLSFAVAGLGLFLGCNSDTTSQPTQPATTEGAAEESKISVALAKLSESDRERALAQKICPVTEELLGSMGTPIKVTEEEREFFLCCKGCQEEAKANFDALYAKIHPPAGQ